MSQDPNSKTNFSPDESGGKPVFTGGGDAPLMAALDWVLSDPSIPLSLRKQFYVMWETVKLGNYEPRDQRFLMSKFREWSILVLWYIPEQNWGNILMFQDVDGQQPLQMDLNILLNTLEQMYYINLTRGKDGFTTKELNTNRSINRSEDIGGSRSQKQIQVRLF